MILRTPRSLTAEFKARLSASVPPEVNTISDAFTLRILATLKYIFPSNQLVDIEDRDVNKVLQETFIRASITKNDGKNETSRVLFNKLLSVDIQQDDLIKTLKRGLYYLSAYSKDHELVGQITDILIRNSNE